MTPKTRKEYNDADMKVVEKNFRAKKILVCGIGPDEYNMISACQFAKEIWEALQTAHEGTTQVKQSKIDMLAAEYELFKMKYDESIEDIHTRFTFIINELHSLGEIIPRNKLVRKILSILPSSWESKVNAITEEKDLQELTIDELVGNLKTYKMKKKIDSEKREPKMEKNLVLKAKNNDSSEDGSDMAYLTKRFQKMPGHFIKDCPLLKQEHFKYNPDKAAKRNPIPDKRFKRKRSADNVVKKALATWGDSSSESEEETDAGDSSMTAVESDANEYDSIFALMAQSDNDEEDDNDEVNFRDVQRNLKSYSPKKLMSLANVLIDAYHSLVDDKDTLTIDLGDVEQTRDDLVVCVVDLKETISNLENKKAGNRFQRERTPYNPHSKYVTLPNNWLCTHCGNNGHFKENCQARVQSLQKNKVFAERGTMKGSSQQWFMDSGCSKHMTGNTMDFLSLKALQGGSLSFGNGKEGYSLGVGKIRKSLNHSIENVYYINGLKYNLLSVSKICDKGNKVEFLSKICAVTNLVTGECYLSCLKTNDAKLYHRRLGHASFSLLNKPIQKDLVRGLPMSKFKEHKVCDACARGKHVKSSFKTKDETFEVFVVFVKKIQVKIESKVACIRLDHGTKFDNAKFDEFCNENGITHNFSAPRTPQKNGIVERKNRSLEEMARTMLIDSGIATNFWAEAVNTACYLVNSVGCIVVYSSLAGSPTVFYMYTYTCLDEELRGAPAPVPATVHLVPQPDVPGQEMRDAIQLLTRLVAAQARRQEVGIGHAYRPVSARVRDFINLDPLVFIKADPNEDPQVFIDRM
ncbi:uncharacterized protein [Nicotiana sylvestris]|uniref:uncharacterized protein n=1 Tax=Nicotiana sylvestris TaxID=4096 RepID=UPI00388C93A8